MTYLELTTAAVSIVSLPLLLWQVTLAARAITADHLRRKQQATLEYLIVHLRSHWSSDLRTFMKKFGDAALTQEQLPVFMADPDATAALVPLLGSIEHLAVGVNMGVYDQDLLNRASGAYLIRTFHRFGVFIRAAQIEQPTAYTEFATLVGNLEAIRASRQH